MKLDPEIAASVNAEFAETILRRAAEIIAAGQRDADGSNAYTALEQARDEFVDQESQSQRKQRTYGLQQLSLDLGSFIRQRNCSDLVR